MNNIQLASIISNNLIK